jgi:hypothetical protein
MIDKEGLLSQLSIPLIEEAYIGAMSLVEIVVTTSHIWGGALKE